ncbi:MAG TPA: PIG-L family deacetylase [Atribacteraceae bacterium]|nr:PIG-L family deacetylase [Atribacteraceae bacterium]
MAVKREQIRKTLRLFVPTWGKLVGILFVLKTLPFGVLYNPFIRFYTRIYIEYIEPFIESSDRIMIIAPHCDDEILAAGGIIQRSAAAGQTVKVVFVTSGDGFGLEYEGLSETNRLPRGVNLGYLRQREAIKALEILGLAKENIIFLGYPDKGLEKMWWLFHSHDQPYYSRNIKGYRSPYFTSYTPGAVFCGNKLLDDIMRLFTSFQPNTLYLPDSYDLHPDHRATYCFVREALETLRGRGVKWVENLQVLLYLVHYGRFRWPPQWGYDPRSRLYPPRKLLGVRRWTNIELTPEETVLKKKALESYRSQKVLREFLLSFAKRTEIFAHDTTYRLPWNDSLTIFGSRRDFKLPMLVGGGDIQKVKLEQREDRFSVALFVDSGIPLRVRYRILLVGYREGEIVFRESYVIFNRRRAVKTMGDKHAAPPQVNSGPGYIRLDFQLNQHRAPKTVFFSAESFLRKNFMVDRFPWSLVVFEEELSSNPDRDGDRLFRREDA